MSDFIKDQERFSEVISFIGKIIIENNQSINDILTINGVNLWLVSSPEMAWRHLVNNVEANSVSAKLKIIVRPYYHQFKLKYNPIKIQLSSFTNQFSEPSKKLISLGFSPKMYSDVVEPVSKKFEDNNSYVLFNLFDGDNATEARINRFQIQSVFENLIHRNKQKKTLFKKLRAAENLITKSDAYYNFIMSNCFGIDAFSIKNLFKLFFNSLAPSSLEYMLQAEEILNQLRPVCIISPDTSDARCRVISLLAKKNNIPTYEIQFGLTGPEGIEWRFFVSSRVAVWGNQAKNILISHGVPKSKIVVTGSPRHDDMIVSSQSAKDTQLESRKVKILFASTYTDPAHERYCPSKVILNMKKSVIDAVKLHDDILLFIKSHPMEDLKDIRTLLSFKDIEITLIEGREDIRDYIKKCDAFLSFGSSATLDALIAGKKVGSLCFDGWKFSDEIIDNLPVTKLNSPKEVQRFINKLKQESNASDQSKKLKSIENLALADGKSSARIYEDICKFIKNW